MTKYIMIAFVLLIGTNINGQQKNYDIVTYIPPAGWTENQADDNISYSRIEGANWAQIAIYHHRVSNGDIKPDFDRDWNELVAANRSIASPERTAPQTSGSWSVMSGSGVWQYNGANVTSVLTVYSGKNSCVAILCNTVAQSYLKVYQSLIGSIVLDAKADAEGMDAGATAGPALTGRIWEGTSLERTGFGNMQMNTGGFFAYQYSFKADGTYRFVNVNASSFVNTKSLNYETGTWSVSGDQLTITPVKGANEEWSKNGKTSNGNSDVSNRRINESWNKKIRSAARKLEKYTYTFRIEYVQGNKANALILQRSGPTVREGSGSNDFYYFETEPARSVNLAK